MRIETLEQAQEMAKKGELIGVFEVPKEIYHKGPGISCSSLKWLDESPAYYQYMLKNPIEPSVAMRVGDAVHARVLEPSIFGEQIVVAGKNGHTKAFREAKEEFGATRTVITEENFEKVLEAEALLKSKVFARKILSGFHEYAFYWIDEETGELCKCRPDSLHKAGLIGDLKYSGANDEDHWMAISSDMKYQMQNAWYLDGVLKALEQSGHQIEGLVPPKRFIFTVVLDSKPMDVIYIEFDESLVEDGRSRCRRALRRLKRAKEENYWPSKFEVYCEDTGKWVEAVKKVKGKPHMYMQ